MTTYKLPEDYALIPSFEDGDTVELRGITFVVEKTVQRMWFHHLLPDGETRESMNLDTIQDYDALLCNLIERGAKGKHIYIRFNVPAYIGGYSDYAAFTIKQWVDMFKKRPQEAKIW